MWRHWKTLLFLHSVLAVRCMSIQVVARTVDRLILFSELLVTMLSAAVVQCQVNTFNFLAPLPCGSDRQLCSMLQRCHFDGLHAGLKKYNVLVCRFIGCASPLHHNSGILSGPVLNVTIVVQIWFANMVRSSACYFPSSQNTPKDMPEFQELFFPMHALHAMWIACIEMSFNGLCTLFAWKRRISNQMRPYIENLTPNNITLRQELHFVVSFVVICFRF